MQITIVAAVADNGVIGRGGGLPWRLKADMAHFRAVTMGKPVVMGRATYGSIGKPLTGRTTIVVSRAPALAIPGVIVVASIAPALDVARGEALRRSTDEIIIAGGAEIYAQTIALADRLDITHVRERPDGDTFFPHIDPHVWLEIERHEHAADAGAPAFTWAIYERSAARTAD